jgi:proteic killer suppression protein
MSRIKINKKDQKQIKKLPDHIVTKLRAWAEQVEIYGIFKTRENPGYHDEPLHGNRKGTAVNPVIKIVPGNLY